jgi:hypothetical protein
MNTLPAALRRKIKETFVSAISVFGLEPVEGFNHIFARAWSIRLAILAGFLSMLEVGLPLIADIRPFPPLLYAVLMMAITWAACIARLVAQPAIQSKIEQTSQPAATDPARQPWGDA